MSWFAALTMGLIACSTAYADRITPVPSPDQQVIAQPTPRSPYQVDLIGEDGRTLDVYEHRGRFYILGMSGQRYTIRVTNPTQRRVEAVVSVDGLDVIDGKSADLRKRGYVVPAGGQLRIDGFRISTQQVATFRFSSVSQSYAGRKGKARNVGVIGVAIFEEQAAPEVILSAPTPKPRPRPRPHKRYDYRDDLEVEVDISGSDGDAPSAHTEAEARPRESAGGSGRTGNAGAPPPRVSTKSAADRAPAREKAHRSSRCCGEPKKKERPGLGTQFGEYRGSNVTWTRFVRANPTKPSALTELRYNDAAGLQALGILIAPPVDAEEIHLRESADPFPGGFAEPPR